MAIRNIVQLGDPTLRKKSFEVEWEVYLRSWLSM